MGTLINTHQKVLQLKISLQISFQGLEYALFRQIKNSQQQKSKCIQMNVREEIPEKTPFLLDIAQITPPPLIVEIGYNS